MKKKIISAAVALTLCLGVSYTALACCGGGYGMGYGMMYDAEGELLSEEDFASRLDALIAGGILTENDRAGCIERYEFCVENGVMLNTGGRGYGCRR